MVSPLPTSSHKILYSAPKIFLIPLSNTRIGFVLACNQYVLGTEMRERHSPVARPTRFGLTRLDPCLERHKVSFAYSNVT